MTEHGTEHERLRSADRLIAAEQEERRRLALALHDGPVQSLTGIALMFDAALAAVGEGRLEEAQEVMEGAVERLRDTSRSLRDLSFALEPVILRDQGFAPAVQALAERLAVPGRTTIDLDLRDDDLSEKAEVVLYQIVREALLGALARRRVSRISVRVAPLDDGGVEADIADDGESERRRQSFDPIAQRARLLNGELTIDSGDENGTTVRVVLPPYTARG